MFSFFQNLPVELIQFIACYLCVADRVMLGSVCRSMRNCLLVDSEGSVYNTDQTYKGMTIMEAACFGDFNKVRALMKTTKKSYAVYNALAMSPRLTYGGMVYLVRVCKFAAVGFGSMVDLVPSWWRAVKNNDVPLTKSIIEPFYNNNPSAASSWSHSGLGFLYYVYVAMMYDARDVIDYFITTEQVIYPFENYGTAVKNFIKLILRYNKVWMMEKLIEANLYNSDMFPMFGETRSPEMARLVAAVAQPSITIRMVWPLRHNKEEFMSYFPTSSDAAQVYKLANSRNDLAVVKMIADIYPMIPIKHGCSIPTDPSMTGILRIVSFKGECNKEVGEVLDTEGITDESLLLALSNKNCHKAIYDRISLRGQETLLVKLMSGTKKEEFYDLWDYSKGAHTNSRMVFGDIHKLPLSKASAKKLVQQFDCSVWCIAPGVHNVMLFRALVDLGVAVDENTRYLVEESCSHPNSQNTICRILDKMGF